MKKRNSAVLCVSFLAVTSNPRASFSVPAVIKSHPPLAQSDERRKDGGKQRKENSMSTGIS